MYCRLEPLPGAILESRNRSLMLYHTIRPKLKLWIIRSTRITTSTALGVATFYVLQPSHFYSGHSAPNAPHSIYRDPFGLQPPSIDQMWSSFDRNMQQVFPNGAPNPPAAWKPRDVLIVSNVAVYALWKLLSVSQRGQLFFFRHFIASAENIIHGRLHSLILSGKILEASCYEEVK